MIVTIGISLLEARKIIAGRGPHGRFWCMDYDKYIGIDNSTGDAWTEEFDTLEACEAWLRGKEA